jgi:hypothetical protein
VLAEPRAGLSVNDYFFEILMTFDAEAADLGPQPET